MIELHHVGKWFCGNDGHCLYVVKDLNLSIEAAHDGEIVVLFGPSGCGKTTILKLISGLIVPDEGEVFVGGERVTGPSHKTVMVPQSYTCFPWLSVLANVEFGLALEHTPARDRRDLAMSYLARVGLIDRIDARPMQLSSGMQQRVAIARTLAMRRPIVLMDEPFGALDAQTRSEMQELLLELWHDEKNLIVFVTHDITEALLLADRIIVFGTRPARILAEMPLPFERPRREAIQHTECFRQYAADLRHLLSERSVSPATGHED